MKPARTPHFDILTIGGATRDVFVRSSHFERVSSDSAPDGFNACFPLGAKIPIDEISFQMGGCAANAAVTFGRFGLKTACMTRVGADPGGAEIRSILGREGIDLHGTETDQKTPTAYSIIFLDGSGHRTILTGRGASAFLDRNTVDWDKLSSSWIYFTDMHGNKKMIKKTFDHTRKSLTRIAWNPGSRDIELGLKVLQSYFLHTDILIFNREEAATMSDCSQRDLEHIFHTLGPLPRQALVITDGAHGAYAYTRGSVWFAPSPSGKIVNTTGAGDAFGSAFVATIMRDGNIEHALQAATLNAGGVIRHMGATTGILPVAPTKQACARIRIKQLRA